MYVAILGRERNLALAELESRFGQLSFVGEDSALFESSSRPDINQFGSIIKFGRIIEQFDSLVLASAQAAIARDLAQNEDIRDFGISWYGHNANQRALTNLLKQIKRQLKDQGRGVRFVHPQSGHVLDAAQLKFNGLLGRGKEYQLLGQDGKLLVAETVGVQDIDAYAKRDRGRPCRPDSIGMLPPKLAQTLINLGSPRVGSTIVDPFCGAGTIAQEALLMGLDSVGMDLNQEMVDCSTKNLQWLRSSYDSSPRSASTEFIQADATKASYDFDKPYSIVTEGFLGPRFSQAPPPQALEKAVSKTDKLYIAFLNNLKKQVEPPNAIVICLPNWQVNGQFVAPKFIDEIAHLGYTSKQFVSVGTKPLRYHRQGQLVARQILVLLPSGAK